MSDKELHIVNVERAKHFRLLQTNINFQALVIQHYFNDYVLELHNQLSEYTRNSEQYNEVLRKLDAISITKSYFLGLKETGRWSEEELHFLMTNPNGDLND